MTNEPGKPLGSQGGDDLNRRGFLGLAAGMAGAYAASPVTPAFDGGQPEKRSSGEGAFLSYASADRAHARLLAQDLSLRGIEVWYDQWDSTVGTPVESMLTTAIQSKAWLMVLLTTNAMESSWVQLEVQTALEHQHRRGFPKVVACVFKDVELPDWVQNVVYADFRTDYRVGFTKLLECLMGKAVRNEYQAFQQLDKDRSRAGSLFRQGKYEESRKLYLGCLQQFRVARGYICLNLGLISFNQYRFRETIKHFRRAYQTFKREGDLKAETNALQYLAHYCALFGRRSQAKRLLGRLLARTKGRTIYSWNVMRKGMFEIEAGKFPSAWKTLSMALKDFEERGDEFGVSAVKYLLARVRIAQGKVPEAVALLNDAMPYSRRSNDPKGVSYTLLRLGQCALLQGDFETAVAHFSELKAVLGRFPDGNVILEAERLLGSVDERRCPEKLMPVFSQLRSHMVQAAAPFSQLRRLREKIGVNDASTLIEGV